MMGDLQHANVVLPVRMLFERLSRNSLTWVILFIILAIFALESTMPVEGAADLEEVDRTAAGKEAINSDLEIDGEGEPTQVVGPPEITIGQITLSSSAMLGLRLSLIGLVLLVLTTAGVLLGNRLALQR